MLVCMNNNTFRADVCIFAIQNDLFYYRLCFKILAPFHKLALAVFENIVIFLQTTYICKMSRQIVSKYFQLLIPNISKVRLSLSIMDGVDGMDSEKWQFIHFVISIKKFEMWMACSRHHTWFSKNSKINLNPFLLRS